jgi:hypothetical protein
LRGHCGSPSVPCRVGASLLSTHSRCTGSPQRSKQLGQYRYSRRGDEPTRSQR